MRLLISKIMVIYSSQVNPYIATDKSIVPIYLLTNAISILFHTIIIKVKSCLYVGVLLLHGKFNKPRLSQDRDRIYWFKSSHRSIQEKSTVPPIL